jgi:endonuclease/exonuclease/phosphatase family metal-dependent hydrolase
MTKTTIGGRHRNMRKHRRVVASFSVILAALSLPTATVEAESIRLRVVTFNAWDLPVVSSDRAARIERMGLAVAALSPDVVAFQELWVDDDAKKVMSDLARGGLVYTQRFPSGLAGSGLHIASRFPISESTFLPYTLGGKPQKPWHGDWYGSKGIGRITVETPIGPIEFADTHLHATYDDSGEYVPVQIAQALEAAEFLQAAGDRPLVLGGDLNADSSSPPFRILASRAGLGSIARAPGIDWILFRSGTSVGMRVVESREVLDTPFDAGDGRLVNLSDHHGVLAVLELSTTETREMARRPAPDRDAEMAALVLIRAEIVESDSSRVAAILLGVGALVACALFVRSARRRRTRKIWYILACITLLIAAIFLSLGAGYWPSALRGLEAARLRLEGSDRRR